MSKCRQPLQHILHLISFGNSEVLSEEPKAGPTLFVGKFKQKPYCTIDCIGFISLGLHQLDAACVCSYCGRHSEMHLWSRSCSASRNGRSSA